VVNTTKPRVARTADFSSRGQVSSLKERSVARYSFSIAVANFAGLEGEYEDALDDAGCDDALVAVVDGDLVVDFDREAPSYEQAVSDLERSGASILRISSLAA
jgi:hypothetical protein